MVTSSSAGDCCNQCSGTSGCAGYTWVKGNNECWLKSAVGSLTSDSDVVSGSVGSGPGPSPGPSPSGGVVEYCPDPAQDFQEERESGAGGTVTWTDDGWSIQGWLRVSSKASFDFSGGGATWSMDLSGAHGGVNNNLYVTYPGGSGNPGIGNYCDSGGGAGIRGCAEMDWTENNGGCFQATTWHDDAGGGDHGGYGGTGGIGSHIDCSTSYNGDGSHVDIQIGGNHYDGNGHQGEMTSKGAVIYSSQWTGWVPGDCGGGDRDSSVYKVKNLKITAKVVSGPEPRRCHPLPPSPPPPTPSPPTPSPPTPSPSGCPGGSLEACVHQCPTETFTVCVKDCNAHCGGSGDSCTGGDDGSDLPTCVHGCPSDSGFNDCITCCAGKFPSTPTCTGGDDGADLSSCVHACPTDEDKFGPCISCCSDKFPSAAI